MDPEEIRAALPSCRLLPASIKNGTGLDELEDEIESLVYGSNSPREDHVMVNNVRHIHLLEQASEDLKRSLQMIRRAEPLDFIEVDVRSAYDALGEIIGETVSDDILNEVFSRFCLGK